MILLAQTAPDGMGGLKWEDSTAKFMELTDPPPDKLMDEKPDGNRVGIRPIKKLGEIKTSGFAMYSFFNDRFYNFFIKIDPVDLSLLKEALILKYGQSKDGKRWLLEKKVVITFDQEKSSLSYIYVPILSQIMKSKKGAAEKSKDSL
jgi:hypothetical protein